MKKPLHHHLYDYFFPHRRNNHRPNIFSITSMVALVLAVIVFEAGYLVQTKIIFLKTDFLASVLPGALVALTNQDRSISGLADVTEDLLLDRAAQAAAEDMAANGYFAHVSPDGKDPWYWLDSVGYKYSYAGENLAVNFTDSQNVEIAWMNSPTHRANIEKPQYTKVGIGTANGMYEGAETTFVVQFFATPAVAKEIRPPQKLSAEARPPEKLASEAVNVLGSQITGAQSASTSAPAALAASAAVQPGWFATLLVSPLNTLMTIFTILFFIIAILFITAIFMRGRLQHPTVIIGGILLLLIISGAMLLSQGLAGTVQLPSNSQATSSDVVATTTIPGGGGGGGGGVKACTMEAKICPDGSAVGRTGPNCEFASCPTTIAPYKSGVRGTVLLGPTCPVERIPPDPACAEKPYATAITVFRAGSSSPFVIGNSDANGAFEFSLPPGPYTLVASGGTMLPRCVSVEVTVAPDAYAATTISCDTGIR